MVHAYEINGLPVKTGDLICTRDGGDSLLAGQFWRFIGKLIPGDVDHIAIFTGPDGKCVEAGAKGCVVEFEVYDGRWDSGRMMGQRMIEDDLHGIAYPLEGKDLTREEENLIRQSVAEYCLIQARDRKPYNIDFLNSSTDDAFYCSQLAYKAYLRHGIDFNTGKGVGALPGTSSIVFPQEVWESCVHRRPA